MGSRLVNFYKRFLLVGMLGLTYTGTVNGQSRPAYLAGAAWQSGTVLVHTPKIKHLAGTNPVGIEINLQKQTLGEKYWQHLYRYPRFGLSFTYFNYQNIILGQSFALSPYISLPVKHTAHSSLYFRFGTGLAYFTNNYNLQENPANNVISNNFNAVIQTRLEYTRQISSRVGLLAAVGLNHYSNGGDSKPNMGINIGTATLGVQYNTLPQPLARPKAESAIPQRTYLFISSSVGVKQRAEFDTVKYTVNAVALGGLYRLNHKSTLLLALEGFYDPSLFARRAWDPRVPAGTTPDIRRFALTGGHDLNFGNLAFGTQVGYYFYRPYKADAGVFQRLEAKWQFHKNIFVSGSLKLHDLIKADIIEYRLGVRI